tara:strand:+ start:200 stop:541 length:342 start_codon:yes stop_codon:yes gene_type:complete
MDNLYYKVKLYLEANGKTESEFDRVNGVCNVTLQNDGSGDYIKTWNVSGLAKPSDSQLNALASNATKENNNAVIRDTRKKSYGDIGEQLDEIYKDIDSWKARIKKIKDDNPKE